MRIWAWSTGLPVLRGLSAQWQAGWDHWRIARADRLGARPEVLVFRAHEKLDANGELADAQTAAFLGQYLAALKGWMLRFRPS